MAHGTPDWVREVVLYSPMKLTDINQFPTSYIGAEGKFLRVNEMPDAVEFTRNIGNAAYPIDDFITKGPYIDARAYGTLPNELGDSGPGFVAAAVAAKDTGKKILVVPGTYTVNTGSIDASYNDFSLVGFGSRFTRINYNAADFFIKGSIPPTEVLWYPRVQGLRIECGVSALGAIKFGDVTHAYDDIHWYYGLKLIDLHLIGSEVAGQIGISLCQASHLLLTDFFVSSFDCSWLFYHVAESVIARGRNQVAVSQNLVMKPAVGAGGYGMDGTIFKDIAFTGLQNGATAIDLENQFQVNFDNLFFEGLSGAAVTALFKLSTVANLAFKNIHIGGNLTATKWWDITNPKQIVIEGARYGDTSVGRYAASEGVVSIAYPSGMGFTPTKDYGNIKLIDCCYLVNSLFAPYPGVQIFSEGITTNGLDAYNRPITGQPFSWTRQIMNLQGKAFMPESNLVFSAWHGQKFHGGATTTIVADSDCSGGYGLSLPAGQQIGPKFAYPSEIMLGDYEIIVRMKAASGTPSNTITILVDDTIKHYSTFAISTTMATYSYRTKLTGTDVGAGLTVSFDLISGSPVATIIDYIVIRPLFNDLIISSHTLPGGHAADADAGNRIVFRSATPLAGTWQVGDVLFYTSPAAGGPPGAVCTTAGTPGTWKEMGNLAG